MFFISFLGYLVVGASGCDAPRLEDTPISQHAFPPLEREGSAVEQPWPLLVLSFLFLLLKGRFHGEVSSDPFHFLFLRGGPHGPWVERTLGLGGPLRSLGEGGSPLRALRRGSP